MRSHIPSEGAAMRAGLQFAVRLCLALSAATAFMAEGQAGPARPMTQVPGYYRYAVGDFVVTALNDGILSIKTTNFRGQTPEEMDALLARVFQSNAAGIPVSINAFLIDTGKQRILIDSGTVNCFGDNPALDRFPANLRAAGYAPKDIDAILITHLHGDHFCALATADGKRRFPKAAVWVAEKEAAYWRSEEIANAQPENRRLAFKQVRDVLALYGNDVHGFQADGAILPGIAIVPTPGHTPGHTSYLVESKGASLLVLGDIVIMTAVQFPHPEVSGGSDYDRQQAVATRTALLERLAREATLVAGAHQPFPGIGHIRKEGTGYVWVPVEFAPLPK
jgi:glyoxylase-like metal-dependent hydrolase (beta-lactamase superfamily II)